MINVYPLYEEELHKMNNLCDCHPSIEFENGCMIVVHNEIVKVLPIEDAIKENTNSLFELYKEGNVSEQEIKNLLNIAIEDEEYEVAVSIKEVLRLINA